MTGDLLGAYLTGAVVGLIAGAVLVIAIWGHGIAQLLDQRATHLDERPAPLAELPTARLPRITVHDLPRRAHGAHRKEHTR